MHVNPTLNSVIGSAEPGCPGGPGRAIKLDQSWEHLCFFQGRTTVTDSILVLTAMLQQASSSYYHGYQ